ncbi:hypothetical protein J6Z19_00170 [bacterium]|nr:hypothetical protein [bacterium]
MFKKLIPFLCTVLMCVFVISCGGSAAKTENNGEEKSEEEASDDISENDDNNGTETDGSGNSEVSDENNEVAGGDDENQESGGNDDGNDGLNENDDSETQDSDEESADEDPDTFWNEVFAAPSQDFETKTEALIVTTDEFAEVFRKFADFHTVTGINTKVVTVEDICENAACNDNDTMKDTQKAIKDYVMSVEGLRYLILGGDIDEIPSRKVHDKFSIIVDTYEDDFYSDLYYADFSEWDSNGNGVYAEDDGTLSVGDDAPVLIANVAVGRISVSTVDEAELYFTKVVKHHTAFNTEHTKKSLLLANIATEISNVKINAGYYFESEGKTASLIPSDYSVKRLYTESSPSPSNKALPLDNDSEKAAIEEGVNLIVHSGHGGQNYLTCEQANSDNDFTGNMAYNLKNEALPFFLSCACEAGQFGYRYGDSAGEKLMNAPEGGAIVYLGNTTTGLGIAGGSQFIDEMLKNMFASSSSIIGDSYLYAHANMPQNDTFNPPVPLINNVPVVTSDSWQWTKKSIVMLGDPMTVFWRDKFGPFEAEVVPEVGENEGVKTLSFHFNQEQEGAALRIFAGEKLYDIPYIMHETIKINLDPSVDKVTVGIKAEDSQYFFKEFDI